MNQELGRLDRVDLRDIWMTEARDFTPWLANENNLELLSETIGIDLELEAQEKGVGPYRADILCKDLANETWVLIENQLEITNHRHLGQILTYAAGLNAVAIVWIAQRFTDEHRATLEWLNEISGDDISFFGLEVELWRIGESRIAPKFNVVVKPNEWTKGGGGKRVDQAVISGTKKLQHDFWLYFREYVLGQKALIKPTKARPQHWMTISIGRSKFHLSAFVSLTKNVVGVDLWIKGPDKQAHFALLQDKKKLIEREVGRSLSWCELPNKKSSKVRIEQQCPDLRKQGNWNPVAKNLLEMVDAMHLAFSDRVKALDADEYDHEDGDDTA